MGRPKPRVTATSLQSFDLYFCLLITFFHINRHTSGSMSDSNSYESDDHLLDLDSDTEPEVELPRAPSVIREDEENKGKLPPVLMKEKPKHSYLLLRGKCFEYINYYIGNLNVFKTRVNRLFLGRHALSSTASSLNIR